MTRLLKRFSSGPLVVAAGLAAMMGSAIAQDQMRVGMPAEMFLNVVEFVAEEKGFYEDQDLEVEFVHIADSSIPVRSLIAGELDVIQTGMSETLAALSRGADLRTIGGVHTGLHYGLYVGTESGIEDVADMAGKRLGISSPGSLPHVVILALLQNAGVSQEEIDSTDWIALAGSSARMNGIIGGSIDATVAGFNPRVIADPSVEMLVSVANELPQYVMTPWDTRASVIEERRDVLKRFITAELLATRWVLENREETLEVAASRFDYNEDELNAFYDFYVDSGIWDPNGGVTTEQAQYMQELNVSIGLQDDIVEVEQVLDISILEEVLDEIGVYEN